MAFVASLVIMVMLQNEFLVRSHVLEAAMILDLFCLIGAYAVRSCRDTSTSIYTVALAGGILIYVVIHILFSTLEKKSDKQGEEDKIKEHQLEKKRELLLLVEILAATLTYQAGLTPPGGFWENDEFGHRAGFPVLLDKFPIRYKAFFLLQCSKLHGICGSHRSPSQLKSVRAGHKVLCALCLHGSGHVRPHRCLCCWKFDASANLHRCLNIGYGSFCSCSLCGNHRSWTTCKHKSTSVKTNTKSTNQQGRWHDGHTKINTRSTGS